MSKAITEGSTFFSRSGSFSTHASRTGVNLLGWGGDEVLTDKQKRDALVKAKVNIDAELRDLKFLLKGSLPSRETALRKSRKNELSEEASRLGLELSKYKKLSNNTGDDLGDYIIQVARSRMTKPQWNCIMDEARALFEKDSNSGKQKSIVARQAVEYSEVTQ